MKIIIEAQPKEIATLVAELLQERCKGKYIPYSYGLDIEHIANELYSSISKTLNRTE